VDWLELPKMDWVALRSRGCTTGAARLSLGGKVDEFLCTVSGPV
jgi:hypothetical protein